MRNTTNPSPDPLAGKMTVRPAEAFAMLGIGHSLGWELIAQGKLKVSRIGGTVVRRKDRPDKPVRVNGVTLVHVDSIRQLLAETEANAA